MVAFVTFALIVLFFTILVLIGKANELSEDLAGKGMKERVWDLATGDAIRVYSGHHMGISFSRL